MTATPAAYNPTALEIMTSALRKCGAVDEREVPNADQYANTLRVLQTMIKEWQATGLHVWTEEEAILFLQKGQYRYLLGGTTTDRAVPAFGWNLATVATAAAAGATTITLGPTLFAGTSTFAVGDSFGVALDSGTTFWTTISGLVAGVATLAAPLPSSAGAGNSVFDYPVGTEIQRPLKVPGARAFRYQGLTETDMGVLSREEYMAYPNKNNAGTPTEFFYSPKLGSGECYVWNCPANAVWGMRFTWYRSIADLLTQASTPDFPQEWASCLEWNLAREIMVDESVAPARAQMILAQAQAKLELCTGYDRESEPVRFIYDTWGR